MLKSFFSPQSVAVIGASTSPSKLGYTVVENLIQGGYVNIGKVFPINPKADFILGQKAYPSVLDVPEKIDLAVIVIPYQHVPEALLECGKKGIFAAVIITAGFREAGMEGLERDASCSKSPKNSTFVLLDPIALGLLIHIPL